MNDVKTSPSNGITAVQSSAVSSQIAKSKGTYVEQDDERERIVLKIKITGSQDYSLTTLISSLVQKLCQIIFIEKETF